MRAAAALVMVVVGCARPAAIEIAPMLHGARATVLATDVATGEVVARSGDVEAPRLPLSVVKLYVAALWWQHGLGDGALALRDREVTVRDVLVDGWDAPGSARRAVAP